MSIQCRKCDYSSKYKKRVDLHENTVHSDIKAVRCKFPGCSFKTKTHACLGAHKKIHEPNLDRRKPFLCDFPNCEYRASRQRTLRLHAEARHARGKTRDFHWTLCPSTFCSESALRSHIARHVKETRFNCEHCEFITHDRRSLSGHVALVHKTLVTYDCSFPGCSYSSTYRLAVRRHFGQVHSSHPDPALRRPFACNFPGCDYRSVHHGNLKKHASIHHNPVRSQEHVCPMCPKKFYTEQSLRDHVNGVHMREKSYKCSKCDFTSAYSANVSRHKKTAHEKRKLPIKWFSCESCDYRTRFKQSLGVHMLTVHLNHRRLHCEEAGCNFKTNYTEALKKHLLIHEHDPERQFPVVCSFPGCDFRRRIVAEIKLHERVHETSRAQFKCKMCPTKFNYPDKNSLMFHNYLCHKEIAFKCYLCDYGAIYKTALAHHVRERHGHGSQNYSLKKLQLTNATNSRLEKSTRVHGPLKVSCNRNSSGVVQCQACASKRTAHDKQSTCGHLKVYSNPVVLIRKIQLITF